VALWGVPALIQTHGEFLKIGIGRHVIGRSFGAMEGHGANSLGIYLLLLPLYFVTIFASFFPWSIKLPWLGKKLWRERDKADIYLLIGTGIIFIIFSLIKTKLPHYTLPAFPLLAILLARKIVTLPPRQRFDFVATTLCFLISIIVPLLGCILVGILLATFITHYLSIRFAGVLSILAALIYLIVAFFVGPSTVQCFPAAQLFRQAQNELRPEMEFGAVDFQEPSLVWYFRSRIKGWMTPLNSASAAQFMEKDGARFVILPTTVVTKVFPNQPATWKSFSTRGFNIAKGKDVDLTLVLKPD